MVPLAPAGRRGWRVPKLGLEPFANDLRDAGLLPTVQEILERVEEVVCLVCMWEKAK